MKWCLLVIFIIPWVYVNGQNITNRHGAKSNFGKYKKCMENYGIPTWKIVDPFFNATYYNIFNNQWNKIFEPIFPIAIVVPSSVSDVQATVKCGYKAKIQLVPNSGGHSYAGLSFGTNDSIIVDFRHMTSIDINERERYVTVGPGAFVGHVNAKLWKNGGWGTPLGNCMTVAMGGHVLGGGMTAYSSLYGLVIDNVLEIRMVDARGNAINPNQNPDLWWAMRGVGPGYIGLVTSYKMKIFEAKDLKLTTVKIHYKVKDFQNVMGNFFKWLYWVKHNEPTIQSVIFAVNDNYNVTGVDQPVSPGIEVLLLHIQDPKIQPNSSKAFLAAFPKFFPKPIKTRINYPTYIEFVVATAYNPAIPTKQAQPSSSGLQSTSANETLAQLLKSKLQFYSTLTKEMEIPRYSFQKSFLVNRKFRPQELINVQTVLSEVPNNTNGLMITSEQGAIGVPRSTDSAYVHRKSLFNIRIRFEGFKLEDVAAGKAWVEKFYKAAQFMDSGKTYQNFPDIQLNDYLFRYYGANLGKLIRIKQKWDPKGYFNSKQSIPTFIEDQ